MSADNISSLALKKGRCSLDLTVDGANAIDSIVVRGAKAGLCVVIPSQGSSASRCIRDQFPPKLLYYSADMLESVPAGGRSS